MRPSEWEQTYAEFVLARQTHLRRLAYAFCGDWPTAEAMLQAALVKLYVAWPAVRRDGTEDSEARRLVLRAAEKAGASHPEELAVARERNGRLAQGRAAEGAGATDLRELVETGLDDGPPHPPIAERVAAGRRAVRRRRRWAVAGSAAAMVTAAGLALALVGPQANGGGGPGPVPPPPKAIATPIPVLLMVAPPDYVSADTPPVLYLYGRMFKRAHDVTVLATYGEIDHSTSHPRGAAIVRVGGRTEWVVIVGNEPERLVAERAGPYNYQLFTAYAELELPILSGHLALAATAPGPYAPPVSDADSPAEFDGTLLVAKPGGTVVQRIRHPLANAQSVQPCHAQGVRIHRPDQDWFVVGFDCRGLTSLYSEPVGVRADTLSTWLAQVKRVQDEFAA